jgi:hypothetical protein
MLNVAVGFAMAKYEERGRLDLFHHSVSVMERLKHYTKDEKVLMAAVLHGILAESHTSHTDLVETFGMEVADMVYELTDDEDEIRKMGEEEYTAREESDPLLKVVLSDYRCTRDYLVTYLGQVNYQSHRLNTMSSDGLLINLLVRLDNIVRSLPMEDTFSRKVYRAQTYTIISEVDREDLTDSHRTVIEEIRKLT